MGATGSVPEHGHPLLGCPQAEYVVVGAGVAHGGRRIRRVQVPGVEHGLVRHLRQPRGAVGWRFAQQRQQWEQQVAALTGQVQDLQRQLQTLSASLQPLTAQLDSVVALYNSLPKS